MVDYLSLYESEQIAAIAAWKSERPSVLGSVVDGFFRPLTEHVTRRFPRSLIHQAVDELDAVARRRDGMIEVARQAEVSDIRQLRFSPLKECDTLASRMNLRVERAAVPGGALLCGRVPFQLVAALRVISRIGNCYGYPLDQPEDRDFIIAILELSAQDDPTRRRQVLDELNGPVARGTPSAANGLQSRRSFPLRDDLFGAVPVVGTVESFTLDASFQDRVPTTARRAFQERWLVENGKVSSIIPAAVHRRPAIRDVTRALSQAAYAGGGVFGFGAAFPVFALSRLLSRGDNPASRGLRDGARAATSDADQFLAGFLGHDEPVALPAQSLGPVLG